MYRTTIHWRLATESKLWSLGGGLLCRLFTTSTECTLYNLILIKCHFIRYILTSISCLFSLHLILIATTPTADRVAASDRERSGTRERVTPSVPLRDRLVAARRSRFPHWPQRCRRFRQQPVPSACFIDLVCGISSRPAPTGHYDTRLAELRSSFLLLHTADNAGLIPPGIAGTPRGHRAEGAGPYNR